MAVKILVSACLMGRNCKYSGGNNYCAAVASLAREHEIIEVCPEVLAGLGTPRTPVEIVDGVLMDRDGNSADAAIRGAVATLLQQIEGQNIDYAVLQSRSPTCGVRQVYDGSFSGRLIPGSGVFAKALMDAGIRCVDAQEFAEEKL